MITTVPPSRCAACGTALPPSAKFCPECAHPVAAATEGGGSREALDRIHAAAAALEGERKLVTILFADLKESTELIADRDPEEARRLLDPVLEHMCEAVEKFGGTVNQIMGDGIMALFGAPVSWEDHAIRACHAALSMQNLVRHYGDAMQRTHGLPIQIRVGLASGEVVLSVRGHGLHTSYAAIGQPAHVAARMEQMAKPGTVLATAETARLAEGHVEACSIGPVAVKGLDRPVEAAEIRPAAARRSRFDRVPARALAAFAGREAELARLMRIFDEAAVEGAGRLATVVGEAGIGKSRLMHAFLHAAARRGARVLDGGAAPYSSGAGYRPGVNILRQYFEIGESDEVRTIQEKVAGRILALEGDSNAVGVPILALLRALSANHRFFGLPVNERRQRVFTALMWLGRRMAADRPLVLAFEDLQWVTSDTLDFLEAFAREIPPSTLVVLTYRPDYQADGLAGRAHLEVRLEGLDPAAAHRFISDLVGEDASLAALKEELARRSAGNPLFIEEYVRGMIESGDLAGEPGALRAAGQRGTIAIPPTVRAVIAARIDRLARADKHVLQALAAFGAVARVELLERLGEAPIDELRRSLRRLELAGLVVERADRGQLAYEFKHALTQAVAYDSLLHARRRELHRRILVALGDTDAFDVLARHAVLGEDWERALHCLHEAGRLAAATFAGVEAIDHFEAALRVLEHLPRSASTLETAFDIHCDLRNALVPLGRHQRLLEVLESARALAEALRDERRLAQVLSFLGNYYGNVGRADLALAASERSLELGRGVGTRNLLIAGNLSQGEIHRTLGNYPKARGFLQRTIALIEPGGEQDLLGQVGLPSVRARSHLAWTLAELGDFHGARAIAEEALRVANVSGHPYSLCHACLGLGGTRVRQGEFESAASILARGLALSEQVPLLRPPVAADLGVAHARCGRIEEGLSHLDAAVEGATSMGRLSRLPLLLVKCGEVHLLAGDADEATRLARTALRLATEQGERGNQVYAQRLAAEIDMARQPASPGAERGFLEALALATTLGMRPLAAHCHAGLGRLYSARGAREDARGHLSAAAALYREMGMRFWLESMDTAAGGA